ncbi:MAG: glycerol-3-phosphate 1-O-acyltransferase PlsY, partial [Nitrospirae bacterium]|nr:glycerol-3-phosphate 1-O-acyltransferase PlsY [Nitrospirota bacterium]
MFSEIFFVLIAYVIGSIPFGILVAKSKNVDLKSAGSRNIGATNVLRTVGKLPALITLLGDSLKGAAAVLLCRVFAGGELWEGIAGIAAIAGHIYPVFLSFKGGKGVATGFGVLIAYSPLSAFITLLIWISVALITKYSSLAAIVAVSALPITFAMLDFSMIKIFFGVLLAMLIVFRHKENIKRLIEGKESKI